MSDIENVKICVSPASENMVVRKWRGGVVVRATPPVTDEKVTLSISSCDEKLLYNCFVTGDKVRIHSSVGSQTPAVINFILGKFTFKIMISAERRSSFFFSSYLLWGKPIIVDYLREDSDCSFDRVDQDFSYLEERGIINRTPSNREEPDDTLLLDTFSEDDLVRN